jgi:hypothetical protein
MRLAPESLGDLTIDVRVQDGLVSARLRVASPQARDLLTSTADTLRAALEAQGLSVHRIDVADKLPTDLASAPLVEPRREPDPRALGGAEGQHDTARERGGDSLGNPQHHSSDHPPHRNPSHSPHSSSTPPRDRDDAPSPLSHATDHDGTGSSGEFWADQGHWVLRVDVLA